MYSIKRTVSLAIIAFSLAACVTVQVGQDFDVNSFEVKVKRGVTTQNEVRGWLGSPSSTGVNVDTGGDRYDEWIYYFTAGRLTEASVMRVKMLQIKFDKQGIVRGYNWSASK